MAGADVRDSSLRELILSEIQRLAKEAGGKPPGQNAFTRDTGITDAKWRGVLWVRWSDALRDAGYAANAWQAAYPKDLLVGKLADFCRRLGKLPTRAEIKMEGRTDPDFPSAGAFARLYPTAADMIVGLRELAMQGGHDDILAMLPEGVTSKGPEEPNQAEGWVYLMKSGAHYKIGRSDNVKRRLDEITIAMPENVTLLHAIKTDDPPGIEAYWHRRFANQRANREWFKLTASDVRAFIRRRFQ